MTRSRSDNVVVDDDDVVVDDEGMCDTEQE